MNLHELKPAEGARKSQKRLGRGIGSGIGKTSGKGHKGQRARSGTGGKVGFEGGQIRLFQRLPKMGFTNRNKKQYTVVNLVTLEAALQKGMIKSGDSLDIQKLLQLGIVSKEEQFGLKVLGDGELTNPLNITAAKFSKSALEKIAKAGGKTEIIAPPVSRKDEKTGKKKAIQK